MACFQVTAASPKLDTGWGMASEAAFGHGTDPTTSGGFVWSGGAGGTPATPASTGAAGKCQ